MYSTRLVNFLMVLLSVVAVAQAAWYDITLFGRTLNRDVAVKRQNLPSSSSAPGGSSTTTSPSPTTGTSTSTVQSSTTTQEQTTTTPSTTTTPTQPSTTTVPSTTTTPSTTTQPSSTTPQTTSTTTPSSTTTPTTTSQSLTTQTTTTVIVTTDSAGSATSYTSVATSTSTAGLSQGSNSNAASGMSDTTRNTIIGVCVGVGGAIILAVLGLLFWRLRAKRRNQEEEDLVSYAGAGQSQFNASGPPEMKTEPSGSANGRSPFQSTLESYHAPTQVNASSNF